MVDSSDSVREFFRNEILEAIPPIRKKNKRPDSKAIFSYIPRNSAINVDESFIDKMLNELLAKKVMVNNSTSCGDSFFIVENCLVEKEKVLRKETIKSIDIITPQKPKNNSTDEHKGNTEQKQNEHRDRPLNSYEAVMAKITELKSFVMEELYTVYKHFTDLSSRIDSGKCHKEIATLNNPSYTDVNSQNDQPFVSPKKSIKINNNTKRAIDVTRNNFVSPRRFSVLNCDEVTNNVLGDGINISNVLKTRHNDATRPIQNAVQNPH